MTHPKPLLVDRRNSKLASAKLASSPSSCIEWLVAGFVNLSFYLRGTALTRV
jgi:hypothetical protein